MTYRYRRYKKEVNTESCYHWVKCAMRLTNHKHFPTGFVAETGKRARGEQLWKSKSRHTNREAWIT